MLTHRVAQRRVISVKSAWLIHLCSSHCVPQCIPTDLGGRSWSTSPAEGECIMLSMPEFPSSSLRIFKSQLLRGLRRMQWGERKGEMPPRCKICGSLLPRLETHSCTWSRKLQSFLRDFCATCQFHNAVAFQHPFPSPTLFVCYAKILTATHSSVNFLHLCVSRIF